MKPIDITPGAMETVRAILARYVPDREVRAFGSRVTWTAKEFSDLDLAVMGDTPLSASTLADISEAFSESELPFKVDVVDWAATKDNFRRIIEKEYVVIQKKGKKSRGMAGEWRNLHWGDLATLEYGKRLRDYQSAQGPYRVFGTNGPIGWHAEALCEHPSVIVGRKGAYRGIHFSPDPFFVIDTAFYLNPKVEFDIKWAYYELLTHDINSIDSGSAIPSTSRDAFYNLPLKFPPLDEQRAIAHILGTLDDKIELNRRMNETLEGMARAIFKSWFIDFDPVYAKAAGRQPDGMDPATAALFPDSFQPSPLGPIPKGWEVKPISDMIELIGGGTPKTSVEEYWGGDIPWFSVVDAPRDSDVFVIDTEKHITELGVNNSSAKILRKGTTIISARGTVGKCALVGRPMAMNQSCYGIQGVGGGSDYFIYFTIRSQVADLQRRGHGSVFNTITRDTFKSTLMACPPAGLTMTFDATVKPLMDLILEKLEENAILVAIRDALLPKLLSGEIRLKADFNYD